MKYLALLLSAIFLVSCSPSVGTTYPVYERAREAGLRFSSDEAYTIELLADVICESRDRGLSHTRMQDYLLEDTKGNWNIAEVYLFLPIVYDERCPEHSLPPQEKHAL